MVLMKALEFMEVKGQLLSALSLPQTSLITDDRWGVEGLYSQQFSVGIFFFLLLCIIVFTVIVVKFMRSGARTTDDGENRLKKGERLMFVWIFFGIVVAVIMAAVQLLQGYLL